MSQVKLKVSELFYSLQGEGLRVGAPTIFIRLQGCKAKHACAAAGIKCDTEFESGKEMTVLELATRITPYAHCKWIVWTGGEPLLQLSTPDGLDAVQYFANTGFKQALETNGGHKPPCLFDWVTCSPKVAQHVWEKNFERGLHELRLVRHKGQPALPKINVPVTHKFVSPLFDGSSPVEENIKHCVQLCLDNPDWRLSLQTHKLLRFL